MSSARAASAGGTALKRKRKTRLLVIQLARLSELFSVIEPELYRYPAIDPRTFRRRVEKLLSY